MESFTGTVPTTKCRRLSGEDCDLLVSADDEYCGVGHELKTREVPAVDLHISGQLQRRRRTTIAEDFDAVTFEEDEAVIARIVAYPDHLAVAKKAVEACAEHHGVDEERARAEIRLLVTRALAEGRWRRAQNGFWLIDFNGMQALLPPAGQVVLSYRTRHYERLPSEVIAGVPSRFRSSKATEPEPIGDTLPFDEFLSRVQDPEFSHRLIASWTKRFGNETELRASFLIDLNAGHWEIGEKPNTWVLRNSERCWAVRADNAFVSATWSDQSVDTDP